MAQDRPLKEDIEVRPIGEMPPKQSSHERGATLLGLQPGEAARVSASTHGEAMTLRARWITKAHSMGIKITTRVVVEPPQVWIALAEPKESE